MPAAPERTREERFLSWVGREDRTTVPARRPRRRTQSWGRWRFRRSASQWARRSRMRRS